VFYQKELREYIQDLADPFILQEIEAHLANKPYASLAKYYEGKPEMAKYTVDHEVTRMAYRIVDGTAEGNGASAAAAAAAADAGANDGGSSNDSSSSTIPPSPPLLLAENDPLSIRAAHASHPHPFSWRLANQSLFAEILQEIQQRFIRADLEVGVVSKDSRFVLDVGKDCVEGSSMFHVLLAAAEEGPVEVARVEGVVMVDVKEEKWTQKVRLVKLQPVFDDVLRKVAEALARHEGEGGGEGGGREGGRRMPLAMEGWREAGQGLLQAVTTVGRMIEEAAAAADEAEEWKKEGMEEEEGGKEQLKATVTRTRPKRGGGAGTGVVEGGREGGEEGGVFQGVMEGLVGGLGNLVGAGGKSFTAFPAPVTAAAAAAAAWSGPGGGGGGGGPGLKLYRQEEDGKQQMQSQSSQGGEAGGGGGKGGGGLWGFLQYSGDMQPVSNLYSTPLKQDQQQQQQQHQQQQEEEKPSLLLGGPPSSYFKGLVTGFGGLIVRGVEAAMAEDEGGREGGGEEDVGFGELLRRRDAAERERNGGEESQEPPALRLYKE